MTDSKIVSKSTGGISLTGFLDRTDVRDFLAKQAGPGKQGHLVSITFPVPAFDPLAALEMVSDGKEFNFYWERPDHDFAFSAAGRVTVLKREGPERFKNISRDVRQIEETASTFSLIDHSLSGIQLVGGFSFFEQLRSPSWTPFGSALFAVPEWLLIRDGKLGLLTVTLRNRPGTSLEGSLRSMLVRFEEMYRLREEVNFEKGTTPSQGDFSEELDEPDYIWMNSVDSAKELIQEGAFKKIVLAREIHWKARQEIAPTHVINTLRNEYPTCYNFLISDGEGSTFIGSSPERLVSFQKSYLLTESLAGSIPRGKTATEDVYLENHLLNSDKNRAEHQFVTESIEKKLQPFSSSIEKGKTPDVKKLRNVQHLYTPIRARRKNNSDRFAILEQLHPTPAVGGYPGEQAMPYIERLESFDRGWYAGPVGWVALNGGGEFAVGIRSSLIEGDRARIFAGCGIVESSDPFTEWEETNLKLMPMLSAFKHDDARQTE